MGAQEIYDRLRTAPQHHPASVELFDDLTLQAGDIITVKSGTTSYEVPVFSQDIHWNGSAMTTVESTGNEKREPLPALRKREMNNQFVGNSRSYGYAKSAKKKQAQTDQWIEDFENTDLWVNRDTIWAVSGAYQVWTDPTTRTKHIQLKDGALLEVDRGDGIYSTVGSSYAIEQVNNEVVNVIEGSALWTQRNGITGVCGEFSVITDPQTGKKRLKIANGTGLVMTRNNAEYGVYDDGTLTGGVCVEKINDGTTTTKILGSRVVIGTDPTSNTTINGSLSIVDGALTISKTAVFSGTDGKQVSINNGTLSANVVSIKSSGALRLVGAATGEYYELTASNIQGFIKEASVDNNVLTLTPVHGDAITFSKATTLSGGWSSGQYVVTATQKNKNTSTGQIVTTTVGTHTYNPSMRLNGSGTEDFSAEIITTSGSTQTAQKSIYGYLGKSGSTSSTMVKVYTSRSGSPGSYSYSGEVASISVGDLYTNGQTNGRNGVSINKGTWANGQVQFTKSAGTASTKGVKVGLSGSWSGNTYNYTIKDYYDSSEGVSTGYTGSITAPSDYDAGFRAGWNSAVGHISRSGNTIKGPKKHNGGASETYTTENKYTATAHNGTLNKGSAWGKAKSQYRIKTPGGTGSWTGEEGYESVGSYKYNSSITFEYRSTGGYWGWKTEPSVGSPSITWT